MKKFALLFRMDITTESAQPTEEQIALYMEQWNGWMHEQLTKVLVDGNHFSRDGKVINGQDEMQEGPYTANKESVAGYFIVKAADMNQAVQIAKTCPILHGEHASVEVRELAAPPA